MYVCAFGIRGLYLFERKTTLRWSPVGSLAQSRNNEIKVHTTTVVAFFDIGVANELVLEDIILLRILQIADSATSLSGTHVSTTD